MPLASVLEDGDRMINLMTYEGMEDKKKTTYVTYGRAFQYKGVALHLRKVGALWVISLFNTGMLTRGAAKTIKEAVEIYDVNEGKIIEEWKYEPMQKKLEGLKHYRKEENIKQLIDLEYQNDRLVKGQQIKAGDLI